MIGDSLSSTDTLIKAHTPLLSRCFVLPMLPFVAAVIDTRIYIYIYNNDYIYIFIRKGTQCLQRMLKIPIRAVAIPSIHHSTV